VHRSPGTKPQRFQSACQLLETPRNPNYGIKIILTNKVSILIKKNDEIILKGSLASIYQARSTVRVATASSFCVLADSQQGAFYEQLLAEQLHSRVVFWRIRPRRRRRGRPPPLG